MRVIASISIAKNVAVQSERNKRVMSLRGHSCSSPETIPNTARRLLAKGTLRGRRKEQIPSSQRHQFLRGAFLPGAIFLNDMKFNHALLLLHC